MNDAKDDLSRPPNQQGISESENVGDGSNDEARNLAAEPGTNKEKLTGAIQQTIMPALVAMTTGLENLEASQADLATTLERLSAELDLVEELTSQTRRPSTTGSYASPMQTQATTSRDSPNDTISGTLSPAGAQVQQPSVVEAAAMLKEAKIRVYRINNTLRGIRSRLDHVSTLAQVKLAKDS
ncbi:hypothetical protein EV182_001096 [Spiromyces aspiralis]|uniref:Uncharacterized protein n=1 Tax=Spiromyces aspiralis TaxID=68401 RepID=A0ACC1HG30_9FUNG|nr:hypothetical protein EV182_001096 [Spiromyces aspiralis]